MVIKKPQVYGIYLLTGFFCQLEKQNFSKPRYKGILKSKCQGAGYRIQVHIRVPFVLLWHKEISRWQEASIVAW